MKVLKGLADGSELNGMSNGIQDRQYTRTPKNNTQIFYSWIRKDCRTALGLMKRHYLTTRRKELVRAGTPPLKLEI